MGSSVADKAARRAAGYVAAIRGDLAQGNSKNALDESVAWLRAELAKARDSRPGDARLIDAEIAASLAGVAARIHRHKPDRPVGCPAWPEPRDMLTVFDGALAKALPTGDSQ